MDHPEGQLTIARAIEIAEEQAKLEREAPSLTDADSRDRTASWQDTLDALRYMEEHGVPDPLVDKTK